MAQPQQEQQPQPPSTDQTTPVSSPSSNATSIIIQTAAQVEDPHRDSSPSGLISSDEFNEAMRRQVEEHLADLEGQESYLLSPRPANLNQTDLPDDNIPDDNLPDDNIPDDNIPDDNLPDDSVHDDANENADTDVDEGIDADNEDEEDDEDDVSSSELELTIRGSASVGTGAERAAPTAAGSPWRPLLQSHAKQDRRGWHLFESRAMRRHSRGSRWRRSTGSLVSGGVWSGIWVVPAVERNSVALGTGIRDCLAGRDLQRGAPTPTAAVERVPKEQFERQLTSECQLVITTAAAAAAAAAAPVAALRRLATWGQMEKGAK